jgi:hypothetical protein
MADEYVQLPADGAGKKLDTESLAVGANTVHRERDQIAGKGATEIAEVKATDPASTLHGLVVRPIEFIGPISDPLSSPNLAAGAAATLDAAAITASKTGKLVAVHVGSSVACKWVISTRDGAVLATVGTCFTGGLPGHPNYLWQQPNKEFDKLAYVNGDENFRIVVTNLDDSNSADVYATVYWDEV